MYVLDDVITFHDPGQCEFEWKNKNQENSKICNQMFVK